MARIAGVDIPKNKRGVIAHLYLWIRKVELLRF
jgi:ribosomal protein S13